jgi:hypothetical protein
MNSLFDKHATTYSVSDFLQQIRHNQIDSVVEKKTFFPKYIL